MNRKMFVRFLLRNEVNDSNKIVGVLAVWELTEAFEFLREEKRLNWT